MAKVTEIGVVAVVKNLATYNGGMAMIRKQMGLTGSSARSMSKTFNQSLGGLGQGILNAGRSVRSFGNELTFLGFQLTFLATGAFAAVISQSVEFESVMVRMSTLGNVATKDLGGLASSVQNLSKVVGLGPTELAEALFFIVSSGFEASEAMQILEVSAKGAAIGLGEAQVVADAVTSAMKTWSAEGLTAARATDILVTAVREGKGEVDRLAGTIGRVLGPAQLLGLSFEEVAAAISTFTRVGVPVEVAVTGLRAAITAIIKPTAQAEEALEKYGLSMADIRDIIETQGFHRALMIMAAALEGDDTAMGKVIGSARGLAMVLINTGPLARDYASILEAMGANAGVAADAFDLFAQTTEFKINLAKAALESLFITVSNTLKPIVNILLDQIPRITNALEDMVKARPTMFLVAGGLALIAAAAGPLLIIVGLTITAIGTAINVLGAFAIAIGGLLSPLGVVIAAFVAFVATVGGLFIASFKKTQQKLTEQGRALSFNAYQWGRNVILSFARGMAAAVGAVIQVLITLGRAISRLLRAKSPPDLLPDLEDWGKKAMEAYMAGWLKADFNVFQGIASTIESFLRSIKLPEIKLVPAIMGMREQLAKIIDQFRTTGTIATEAIKSIVAGFGEAGVVVGQYISAMLQLEKANIAVEQAQKKLNDTQAKFDDMLAPINAELEAIARRRQDIVDQMRQEELQAILDDENAPALAKELALMELREIQLRKQGQTIEDQKEKEVSAAEEALAAAQEEQRMAEERAEALRQFIAIQEQNNNLIKEQIELLKRLAEAMEDVGGGGVDIPEGGIGDVDTGSMAGDEAIADAERIAAEVEDLMRRIGGIGGPDDLGLGSLGDLSSMFGDIGTAANDLVEQMSGIVGEITTIWQPVLDLGGELTDVWSTIFSSVISGDSQLDEVMLFLQQLSQDQITKVGELGTELGRLFGNLEDIATGPIGELVGDIASLLVSLITLGGVLDGLFKEGGPLSFLGPDGPLSQFSLDIDNVGEALLEALVPTQKFTKFLQFINETLELITPGIEEFIRKITIDFENFIAFVGLTFGPGGKFSVFLGAVADPTSGWDDISQAFLDMFTTADKESTKTEVRLGSLARNNGSIFTEMRDNLIRLIGEMASKIEIRVGVFWEALVGEDGFFSKIKKDGIKLFDDLKKGAGEAIGGLISVVDEKFQEFLGWVGGQIEKFTQIGRDIGQGILDGIMEMLSPLIATIEGLLQDLIAAGQGPGGADTQSPSKPMIKLGHDMMEGVDVGMMDYFHTLANTVRGIIGHTIAQAHVAANLGQHGDQVGAQVAHPATSVMTADNSRTSTFGPIHIHTGMDVAMLKTLIRQEVAHAI